MKVRKLILYSLLPGLALAIVLVIVATFRTGFEVENIAFPFLIAAVLWAIGMIVGLFVSAILSRPHWDLRIYLFCQVAMIVAFMSLAFYQNWQKAKHEREFGNIEDNRGFVDWSHGGNKDWSETNVQIAFKTLESSFQDPNSFHISNIMVSKLDTFYMYQMDSMAVIYFTYTVNEEELFSKVTVLMDTARVEIFNGDPHFNSEYLKRRNDADENEKRTLESIKKDMDALPDSFRKRIADTISKALKD